MKPYIAVLSGIVAWTITGCLELATQNPSSGVGSSASTGGAGGAGIGGTSAGGGGGNPPTESCGNGTIESGEQCDDGNEKPGDGCNPQCVIERVSSLFVGKPGTAGIVDGVGPEAQLSTATSLALFGNTLFLGDTSTVRIVDVTTAQVTTIAGAAATVGYTDSASGVYARFNNIKGLATDGNTLWVADTNNHVIRAISLTPPYPVTTVAGSSGMTTIVDGVGSNARLDSPRGITYFNGYVYFVELNGAVLRRFDPATREVITLAGAPFQLQVVDGKGSNARFAGPRSLVADGTGSLYITDTGGHSIRKYDIITSEVKTIAGDMTCSYADGPALAAKMDYPRGISFDEQNIYWVEFQAHTIRQQSLASGEVLTISGIAANCAIDCTCMSGSTGSYSEGIGSAALWNVPYDSVYHKPSKSLFIADSQNFVIRRVK